ncbi:beta-lactamase family protein [bacterium]|nr:beta-lactamase family protein [bacterium]
MVGLRPTLHYFGYSIMKFNMFFIAILSCFLVACSGNSDPPIEDQLQRVLDKEISKSSVHGVSAAVIFPDETIWLGTSGISYDTVAMKPDMLFAIGSITKNVVATLILKLVEENVLSLEDSLSKWLPPYPHIDSAITLRQLLNHTSGLYMFWDNQQIWDDLKAYRSRVFAPEEVLGYIKEPYFAPGDGWRYSNTNYLLLAMIIEKATDSKLSIEFRNRFWQPLGLEDTYLILEEELPDHLAHVYGDNFNNDGSYFDLTFLPRTSHESITWGSSGIWMMAGDLVRWSHALFEGKVLQRQSMNEMLQFATFKPVSNMRAYGLGVQLYTRGFVSGKEAIGHGGGNIGSTTYMVYLPEYHVSIVVMINAYPHNSADVITKGLIRTVLKDLDAIGLIPYFDFFPTGLFIIYFVLFLLFMTLFLIRKGKKVKKE